MMQDMDIEEEDPMERFVIYIVVIKEIVAILYT